MPEFLTLLPPEEALSILIEALPPIDDAYHQSHKETLSSTNALGRVTAEPVAAPEALPPFPRATVDGYAVQAADTYGASESLPAYLDLLGEILMGTRPGFALRRGGCGLIHTGGMLPEGADAVVMVEHTQTVSGREVEILRPVAVGENVIKAGEDVQPGDIILPAGRLVRPAEIGGLMGLGIPQVEVMVPPLVGILSTGDEVVPPGADLQPGQIRDVNTYSIKALVERAGGEAVPYGIIPDRAEAVEAAAHEALAACDMVVITAGSSASTRDLTADVINRLGAPGVLVHGVNVRPGKPTILGVCGGKPVFGLPGNPVSALVIAGLFVVPTVRRMLGLTRHPSPAAVKAQLTLNLASQSGREDWIAVQLESTDDGYQAEPIFGKSNLIFTLARADGLIKIPAEANGLAAGTPVEVFLL
jgi:molybdopterin molybdotransferase